eukprot:CAMPEP_0185551054 /NCGR_PEP_ID=MMETSP1381-20130426/23708_1 /TAXON_ID=298111 /ORGANISM="Pavlova sp., Strain CCMP459" /LENGTH=348 /DNA_ID=CAMNT_0028163879 /DNA_START=121 /DNA_END=1168 /DNA_ORIENTATION=+
MPAQRLALHTPDVRTPESGVGCAASSLAPRHAPTSAMRVSVIVSDREGAGPWPTLARTRLQGQAQGSIQWILARTHRSHSSPADQARLSPLWPANLSRLTVMDALLWDPGANLQHTPCSVRSHAAKATKAMGVEAQSELVLTLRGVGTQQESVLGGIELGTAVVHHEDHKITLLAMAIGGRGIAYDAWWAALAIHRRDRVRHRTRPRIHTWVKPRSVQITGGGALLSKLGGPRRASAVIQVCPAAKLLLSGGSTQGLSCISAGFGEMSTPADHGLRRVPESLCEVLHNLNCIEALLPQGRYLLPEEDGAPRLISRKARALDYWCKEGGIGVGCFLCARSGEEAIHEGD